MIFSAGERRKEKEVKPSTKSPPQINSKNRSDMLQFHACSHKLRRMDTSSQKILLETRAPSPLSLRAHGDEGSSAPSYRENSGEIATQIT